MTPEQLRKIDTLVAEKVMGFTFSATFNAWVRPEMGIDYDFVPPFSTDIAAAWNVVGKIRDLRIPIGDFTVRYDGMWRAGWYSFYDEGEWEIFVDVAADSAPLAICLAVLKAVDVDVREFER